MSNHLITFMVFFPLFGALLQAVLPSFKSIHSDQLGKWTALGSSLAASICGLILVASMQQVSELQATETLSWIGSYEIRYFVGIDGLNALLVLLVSGIFPILIASEWKQPVGMRGMFALLLVLQSAFSGVVCAQDLFLQFFFWGLSALPFYFLIGIWGNEKRESAAFQYFITASLGNVFLFAALILIYYSLDSHSFSLQQIAGKLTGKTVQFLGTEFSVPSVAVTLISAGLALRAAIWPFHGWFTQVAKEAPASVFVALCAVTVPVANYMFIRLCYTLFPEMLTPMADTIVVVGAINLVLGGVCAAAQRDLRLLMAFVCISEVGFMLVGIGSLNQAGVVGAIYQQLVFGLGLAGFGFFSGLLAGRSGNSAFLMEDGKRCFGGIATKTPVIALVAGVCIASILGIPGFGGFVGHSLLIIGSYPSHPMTVILAVGAVLLSTFVLFVMYRAVFLGKSSSENSSSKARQSGNQSGNLSGNIDDLSVWERVYLMPIVGGIIFCGVYPKPLLDLIKPTVSTLLAAIK